MDDWSSIDNVIDRVVAASNQPLHPDTIANAKDLIALLLGRCPVPNIAKGFRPTLCLDWPGFEVEVFTDRYDLNRSVRGRVAVTRVPHTPGQPFPPTLLAEFPMVVS